MSSRYHAKRIELRVLTLSAGGVLLVVAGSIVYGLILESDAGENVRDI